MMSDFWPKGLELSDTASPMEILEAAQSDWNTNSHGALTLVFQKAKAKSGNDIIIVHAKHIPSKRTATLFSVVHRPNTPYPISIQPKNDDLPTFLMKSYYKPGVTQSLLKDSFEQVHGGKTVTNYWVSDTPSEFRTKLGEVFNLGIVKSEILNLASNIRAVTTDDGGDGNNEEGEHPEEN
jgi:hypothetical protein